VELTEAASLRFGNDPMTRILSIVKDDAMPVNFDAASAAHQPLPRHSSWAIRRVSISQMAIGKFMPFTRHFRHDDLNFGLDSDDQPQFIKITDSLVQPTVETKPTCRPAMGSRS
jgi:hypothetical protein